VALNTIANQRNFHRFRSDVEDCCDRFMREEILFGKSGSSCGNRNKIENRILKQSKYAIYTTLIILYIITSNIINSLSGRFE